MSEIETEKWITKIISETGLSKVEIEKRVNDKINDLKGLISRKSALIIIAQEFGVKLNYRGI